MKQINTKIIISFPSKITTASGTGSTHVLMFRFSNKCQTKRHQRRDEISLGKSFFLVFSLLSFA